MSSVAFAAGSQPGGASKAFRDAERVLTPDGIQVQRYIEIGGIKQWISIRGRHRDNPILLFLHGGPGLTSIPSSYYDMKGWDEYFTVVQWDQRGAGKTYLANDPTRIRSTMTISRMVGDAAELVQYLRKTYGRKRIVLMGHSWGTVLGVELAQRHPNWFYAYVGMGQFVDFQRSEALGYQATLAAARADRNKRAVAELKKLAPYPDVEHPMRSLAALMKERHWLEYYDGDAEYEQADLNPYSPDYTQKDLKARSTGIDFSIRALWGQLSRINFTSITRFGCPVIFMQGRHDLTTSAQLLGQWYAKLHAPYKKLVWFDDSAHMVDEEEPGKVLVTLVNDVLPLTYKK